MRPSAVFAMVVVAGLLIGACSGAATPAPSAPAGAGDGTGAVPSASAQTTSSGGGGAGASVGDPCSLLTQAEVSAVVGQPVGPGSSADDPKRCDWQYPVGNVPTVQASIGIEDGTLADMCGTKSNPALGLTITPVSGVGDGACFQELAGLSSGTNLTFGKNGHTFQTGVVLGSNATSAQILDADKTLALDALARL